MPIRYMGTKRVLAPTVRQVLDEIDVRGPVVDLFSGMGSVAEALAPRHAVVVNDLLSFTSAFGRARFTATTKGDRNSVLRRLRGSFSEHKAHLRAMYSRRLAKEARALEGSVRDLQRWFDGAPHVGRSRHYERIAASASAREGCDRYRLVTVYFASGYLSTRQAIEADALRFAIDVAVHPDERDWALASWILAISRVVNAPGHTAQFLKPSSKAAAERIRRTWARTLWPLFVSALDSIEPLGTRSWRGSNQVVTHDALELLRTLHARDVGAVYADPPYTKDQYSRYYHLYETLYRYDFPDALGNARARSDRFSTEFCLASAVASAMEDLVLESDRIGRPLVLSYPSNGLLSTRGIQVSDLIERHRSITQVIEIPHAHSTLGARAGKKSKATTECIYVSC